MKAAFAIAKKDIQNLFCSFRGYGLLFFFTIVNGFFFIHLIENYQSSLKNENIQPSLEVMMSSFWSFVLIVMSLVIPFMTAPSYGDEIKNKTFILLKSAPLSDLTIFFGKYLSLISFLICLLISSFIYPLHFMVYGTPPIQKSILITGYISIFLFSNLYICIGLIISKKICNTINSLLFTFLVFIMLGFFHSFKDEISNEFLKFSANYLSPFSHTKSFFEGIIQSSHLIYFLSTSALCFFFLEKKWLDKILASIVFLGGMFLTQRPNLDKKIVFSSITLSEKTISIIKKTNESKIEIKGYFREKYQKSEFENLLRIYQESGFHASIEYFDSDVSFLQAKNDGIQSANQVRIERKDIPYVVFLSEWDEEHFSSLLFRLMDQPPTKISIYPENIEIKSLLFSQGFFVEPFDSLTTKIVVIPPLKENISIEEKKNIEDFLKKGGKLLAVAQALQPINNLNDLIKPFGIQWNTDFLVLKEDHPIAKKIGQNHSLYVYTEEPLSQNLSNGKKKNILTDVRSLRVDNHKNLNIKILAQSDQSLAVDNITTIEDVNRVEPEQISQQVQRPLWAYVQVEDKNHSYFGSQGIFLSGRDTENSLISQSLWILMGEKDGKIIPSKEYHSSALSTSFHEHYLWSLMFGYPLFFLLLWAMRRTLIT